MHVSLLQRLLSKPPTKLARDASARLAAARQATAAESTRTPASEEARTTSSVSSSSTAASPPPPPPPHSKARSTSHMAAGKYPLSPLYDPSFMGASSRFRMHRTPDGRSAVTRAVLTGLERDRLTHASPSTVNDHLCISMVKALRWVSDRFFRERHIHRATMLKTLAAAPATAAAVTTFIRLTGRSARESSAPTPIVLPRAAVYDHLGEALSGGSSSPRFAQLKAAPKGSATPQQTFLLADRLAGLDTMRGLLAQAECHTAHHQIMIRMADITSLERFFVLFAQGFQFVIYGLIFLLYPRMGFRLIGYTFEESSVVWTQMINDIDLGKISDRRVPALALEYWGLEGCFVPQGAPPPVVVVSDEDAASSAQTAARSPFGPATTISSSAATSQTAPPSTESAARSSGGAASEATETAQGNQDKPHRHEDIVLTLRDVVLLIRSDEMYYRDACHKMADEIDRVSRERSTMSWSQRFIEWGEAWLKK